MTTDKIFGILKLDHPSLTDDQFRAIQLGEEAALPDGTTVAEYAARVEALKQQNLEEESARRAAFLEQTQPNPTTIKEIPTEEEAEEEPAVEPESDEFDLTDLD